MHEIDQNIFGNDDIDEFFPEIDNEWYTFVSNDKTNPSEMKDLDENEYNHAQRTADKKPLVVRWGNLKERW